MRKQFVLVAMTGSILLCELLAPARTQAADKQAADKQAADKQVGPSTPPSNQTTDNPELAQGGPPPREPEAAPKTPAAPKHQEQKPAKASFADIAPYGGGFHRTIPVDSQFALYLGGHVKADVIVDSQQIDSDLPFYALPEQTVEVADDGSIGVAQNPRADTLSTNIAARELLLYLGAATPTYGDWRASAYLEFNFLGFLPGNNAGSPTPILRHGYATLENTATGTSLLFGQAQGPFAPRDPQTVNWETYVLMGDAFTRLPQVRLTQAFDDWTVEAAAVRPADYANDSRGGYDVVGRGQDSGLPEFQGRVSYNLPTKGHYWFSQIPGELGLSGRYARERFHAGTDQARDIPSWTVAADAVVPAGPLTFQAEVYYGKNSDNVYGLGGVLGRRPTPDTFDPVEPVAEVGGWASVGWNITQKWYASLIYGRIQPDVDAIESDDLVMDTGRNIEHNQSVTANAYYRILPTLFVAGEYIWLNTRYFNRGARGTDVETVDGTLHRAQLAFLFAF